jgi:hypothetical protein
MTTSPSEPVDNAQVADADELPSGGKDDILSDGHDHADKSAPGTSGADAGTAPEPPD